LSLLRASLVLRIINLVVQLVALDLPQNNSFPEKLDERRKKLEIALPKFFAEVLD
jgi:hypothetical protein